MHSYLLSIAYAPPVQYLCKLYAAGGRICLEGCESFVKQTYRNRCLILSSNGPQTLILPIEQGSGHSSLIREVRLSEHSQWARIHTEALRTAYGASPYFEFYWDDIEVIYRRRHSHLWELNLELTHTLAELMDLPFTPEVTSSFLPPRLEQATALGDLRYALRPKNSQPDPNFHPQVYYQPWCERLGFVENLSAFDLLFNMGPESILVLRDSIR